MREGRAWLAGMVAIAIAIAACGGSSSNDATPQDDAGGEADATPPPSGCAPGELAQDDGHCEPAGIPPASCGKGFEADGNRGCNAVLPAAPCPAGQMAVPGETTCHEVSPCGAGKWGDIPVEASTQYVDASFAGTSDGSAGAPWKTIGDAIRAAAVGDIVAVAAGTYAENVALGGVLGKAVRLWGVCPAKVEIAPTATGVMIRSGANGAEVHTLAIRGGTRGLALSGSHDVVFDHVWIHDVAGYGVQLVETEGAPSATLRSSLVEAALGSGVDVEGATLGIESVVVRDTRAGASIASADGRGLNVVDGKKGEPSNASVRGSVVDGNHDLGVFVGGATVTMENTVVRGTLPFASGGVGGRGISVQADGANTGALTLTGSIVENNRELGVHVEASTATIDASVVRGTLAASDGTAGRGVNVQMKNGVPSTLAMHASVIEGNREVGVFVAGSQATIESTLVRGTVSEDATGTGGEGVSAQDQAGTVATLTLRGCVLQSNGETGLFAEGSDLIVERTVVRDTRPRVVDALGGIGLQVQDDPPTHATSTAKITTSLFEGNSEVGIAIVSTDATLDGVIVRDTHVNSADGLFGDGVFVVADGASASATITGGQIEGSARAGVSSFGATVSIGGTTLECNAIPLVREALASFDGAFTDAGGNACGCKGTSVVCQILTSGLAPPTRIEH